MKTKIILIIAMMFTCFLSVFTCWANPIFMALVITYLLLQEDGLFETIEESFRNGFDELWDNNELAW